MQTKLNNWSNECNNARSIIEIGLMNSLLLQYICIDNKDVDIFSNTGPVRFMGFGDLSCLWGFQSDYIKVIGF